jgi:hypothetical protein
VAVLSRRVDGIDVYQLNGVNWPGIADMNVWIGIAKAWHETNTADTKFREFWPAMRNAGLIRGAYLLIKPPFNLNRAGIESLVQNFMDRIDAVGGLQPGDLPPMLDFEGGMAPAAAGVSAANRTLDQLAWAVNKITPYLQDRMRNPNALPMIYVGRLWTDTDSVGDPTAAAMSAYATHEVDPGGRATVNFTACPLWWSWIHFDPALLDLTKAADLAKIPYPRSWPGPRKILFQFTGHMPMPAAQAGQAEHDANVAMDVAADNTRSLSADFSYLLKLANVAPLTNDVHLTRVSELSDAPPDQVFSLLLIGQGFWPDEFDQVVRQGLFGKYNIQESQTSRGTYPIHARQGVFDIAPFNNFTTAAGKNAIACYYDPGAHADGTGLFLPLRQETVPGAGTPTGPIDRLRMPHPPSQPPQVLPPGRSLAEYLAHLTVKLSDDSVHRATEYWPVGQRRTGAKGTLVAVLRKAPFRTYNEANKPDDDPRPAELYQLDPTSDDQVPFIAVNVVPFGDWPLVLARAIAQNLANVSDEYEFDGAAFDQPAEAAPPSFGPNVITIDDSARQALIAGTAATVAVPEVVGAWGIPAGTAVDFVRHAAATANPIAAWDSVTQPYNLGSFHLVEGAAGFRTHIVRCDNDCLMRRIPAQISGSMQPTPALPVQSDMRVFCKACEERVRRVIRGGQPLVLEPRVELDTQRRLFDSLVWPAPTNLPLSTVTLANIAVAGQPQWSCKAEFAAPAGFRFTDINLINPDYWMGAATQRVAHVLQSVTFDPIQLTFKDGKTVSLAISDALKATAPTPSFDASALGDNGGRYQVGARLALSWSVLHSTVGGAERRCIVDAELSLVLASMENDLDPGGVMLGCRLYPQMAVRVRSMINGIPAVTTIKSAITLVANNADPGSLTGTLKSLATGKLTTSAFCESNRASAGGSLNSVGVPLDKRKRANLAPMTTNPPPRLTPPPHWSWIYDYCNTGILARTPFVGTYSRADGAKGATSREFTSGPAGPVVNPGPTIHKLPRQGAYDSLVIHPDRPGDPPGLGQIAAPFCADLGLHLHWRRGLSLSGGSSPLHLFRGWGAGRLGQGARTVLGTPVVPPNQHIDVEVAPAFDRSTVNVKYAVTATEIAANRWELFMEQGIGYAFQYAAIFTAVPSVNAIGFQDLGWLAEAMGADKMVDVNARLTALVLKPDQLDAAIRGVWSSILSRCRRFDQTLDGSIDPQALNGPSDPANLEKL